MSKDSNITTPSTEQNKELWDLMKELIKTNEGKRAFMNVGGLIRGTNTYYKRKHAEEIIEVLDAMIATRENYEFLFVDMEAWYKPETVWLKINQSVKYVIDYMDTPDKKYYKLRQEIIIHRRSKVGVSLEFIQKISMTDNAPRLIARKMTKEEVVTVQWRANLVKFLESEKPPGEQLIIDDLDLKEEDRETLSEMFADTDEYIVDMSGWPKKLNIIFDPEKQIPRNEEE